MIHDKVEIEKEKKFEATKTMKQILTQLAPKQTDKYFKDFTD